MLDEDKNFISSDYLEIHHLEYAKNHACYEKYARKQKIISYIIKKAPDHTTIVRRYMKTFNLRCNNFTLKIKRRLYA